MFKYAFLILTFVFGMSSVSVSTAAAADDDKSKALTQETMIDFVMAFGEIKKLEPAHKSRLHQALKYAVTLEKIDNSRIAPLSLSDSYTNNKTMYQEALKGFSKADQKILKELYKILEAPLED